MLYNNNEVEKVLTNDIGSRLHLSFDDAQALYSVYSTFQTNEKLRKSLYNILGSLIPETINSKDSRELINKIILKYYPNEISVKSNFINQVLFRSNSHVTIFELPIGNSRIDLCKLNGTSVAYEIKTDLDNLTRLEKQLKDYIDIFEKVYVICSINRLKEIEDHILPFCGIYFYSISKNGKYKFKLHRKAIKSQCINPEKQLSILRKAELYKYFSVCSKADKNSAISYILHNFSPHQINSIFKKILKLRYQNQWEFLKNHKSQILEIDYQWFFQNNINPNIIYSCT